MKRIALLFLLSILFLGISTHAQAQQTSRQVDVVYLKNGSIIRGQVISYSPDEGVRIQTADGSIFVYEADSLERITKETDDFWSSSPAEMRRQARRTLAGYKGFVDVGISSNDCSFQLGTSHGYQFNNYVYLGGGLGIHHYFDFEDDVFAVPVFLNFRVNFLNKRVTPLFDLKLGYSSGDLEGAFASLELGIRIALTGKKAINVQLGYTEQEYEYAFDYWDSYYYDSDYLQGISLRVGFEF